MKQTFLIAFTSGALLLSAQTQAGWLDGIVQQVVTDAATNMAKETAKETAKEVARQNGIEGADGMIDTAVDVSADPGMRAAIATGNAGVASHYALETAIATRQMNTPIPAEQLQQYPPSIADLNRDGVVTYGEVHQIQQNQTSSTPWLGQPTTTTAPTHQPADLNQDGVVTAQEISAYQAAVAQVAAQNSATQQAQITQPTTQASSSGLGGMFGGLGNMFGSGSEGSNNTTEDSASEDNGLY